jgi:hypothetical protein
MQKRTNLTPSKGQLAPMLIARVDTLATVRANGLALLAWLACPLWFPAFGIRAGQRMEAVVDWITVLGVILVLAAAVGYSGMVFPPSMNGCNASRKRSSPFAREQRPKRMLRFFQLQIIDDFGGRLRLMLRL